MFNRKAFADRLKRARNSKGLTGEMLAAKSGVTEGYIRSLESANRNPSIQTLVALCNALEVSPYLLLQDSVGETEFDIIKSLQLKESRKLDEKQTDMMAEIISVILKYSN